MIMLLITFFFFAAGITANKMALVALSPLMLTGIRMLAGGVILMGYQFFKGESISFGKIRSNWRLILTIALLTTLAPAFLKSYGLKYLYSFKASIIAACDPFVTAVYGYFLWGERLTVRKGLGIVVAFTGIVILFLTTSRTELLAPGFWHISLPELAAFLAIIIGRYGWIKVQRVVRSEHYSPIELNSLMMIVAGIGALSITLTFETFSLSAIAASWKSLVATTLIGNVFAYTMLAHQLKKHSSMVVSLAGYAIPIFVLINGIVLLGEPVQMGSIAGGLIVFSGLLLFYSESFLSRS